LQKLEISRTALDIDESDNFSITSDLDVVSSALEKVAVGIKENKLLLNLFNTCGSKKITQEQCKEGLTKVCVI